MGGVCLNTRPPIDYSCLLAVGTKWPMFKVGYSPAKSRCEQFGSCCPDRESFVEVADRRKESFLSFVFFLRALFVEVRQFATKTAATRFTQLYFLLQCSVRLARGISPLPLWRIIPSTTGGNNIRSGVLLSVTLYIVIQWNLSYAI